jgi:hypothetical protein
VERRTALEKLHGVSRAGEANDCVEDAILDRRSIDAALDRAVRVGHERFEDIVGIVHPLGVNPAATVMPGFSLRSSTSPWCDTPESAWNHVRFPATQGSG